MRVRAVLMLSLAVLAGCGSGARMKDDDVVAMGNRYIEAWNSADPGKVAEFFSPDGTWQSNTDALAKGRDGISVAARGFMSAFPDLRMVADGTTVDGTHATVRWTMTATNSGPGGTGKYVRISGRDDWTIGADHLIAASQRHFDAADLDRQIRNGFGGG